MSTLGNPWGVTVSQEPPGAMHTLLAAATELQVFISLPTHRQGSNALISSDSMSGKLLFQA